VTARAIGLLSRVAAVVAGIVLIYVLGHTLLEITLRTLFNRSTNVVIEYAGYGLAAMTYLGLSDAMRSGTLVRVNVVLDLLPRGARRFLDAFCVLVALLATVLVIWFVWVDMSRSWTRDYWTESVIPLPAWLPPIGLLVGMAVFALDLALHLVLILRGEVEIAAGGE
jgi:TRAP-type C4-dicarboxylate transport system permease small subunit